MNKRLCLKIARRVNTVLTEQLGEGVQAQRMLDDALYARDVLLVCDAMSDPELRKLSRMFRHALVEPEPVGPTREPLRIGSMLNSIFGHHGDSGHGHEPAAHPPAQPAPSPAAVPRTRRWFHWGDRDGVAAK